MDDAERAYEAAKREIERVRGEGKDRLDLEHPATRALNRLPPEIAGLKKVEQLDLGDTGVTDADMALVARMAGLTTLWLNNTAITDAGAAALAGIAGLTRLSLANTAITDAGAAALAGIAGLEMLSLDNTAITDAGAAALVSSAGLKTLYLNDTAITDAGAAALAGSAGLRELWLNNTAITDAGAAALAGSAGLTGLSLDDTAIRDLRPFRDHPGLATGELDLWFSDTPATRLDPEIARIAALDSGRSKTLHAYLTSLDDDSYTTFLARRAIEIGLEKVPDRRPSPLPVTVDADGTLRTDFTPPEARQDRLAREGWGAMRDSAEDFRDSFQIGNFRALSTAVTRLLTALGDRYEDMQTVRVGAAARRVAAQAADESVLADLPEGAAPDLIALAAQAETFMQRFPDWIGYLEDQAKAPPSAARVAEAQEAFAELAGAVRQSDHVEDDVKEGFDEQFEDARESPEDETAARSLLASTREVLRAVAEYAVKGLTALGGGAIAAGKLAVKGTVKGLTALGEGTIFLAKETVPTVAMGVAGDILFNHSSLLLKLAHDFPEAFGWITNVLRFIGAV